ncbi:DUF4167 domain-containing protein [Breoghania sp.]|uniref:DUF4167 domain-containing protein n=1 Tax=Breoghania sp. TaxID=2065378 RepID=UPI002AA6EC05|nr:DUF4167 domain-containing protein [Breoghania sp.]
MRQNNQNKRLRGRGRKGPNPLTRSFESNGPDVKIRGTAMHIAEKYQQLARDAMVSGDRIMAENYLQHAEHYSRIVAAAQTPANGAATQSRANQDVDDDEDGEEQIAETPVVAKTRVMPQDAPQPFVDRMPGIDARNGGEVTGGGAAAEAEGAANGGDAEKPQPKPRRRPARATAKKAAAESPDENAESVSADGEEAEGGEETPRPRRRARGARGRNVRRAAANAAEQEDGSGDAAAATEASDA